MSRFWSDTARRLTPYVPGEQPKLDKLVKLNTNESPYGPSPRAIEAIAQAASEDLRRYPDPNSDALKAALARYHSVAPAQNTARKPSVSITPKRTQPPFSTIRPSTR